MERKERRIIASPGLQCEAARTWGVTVRSVQRALAYSTVGGNAGKIRAWVLNHGGKLCETRILENPYKETVRV